MGHPRRRGRHRRPIAAGTVASPHGVRRPGPPIDADEAETLLGLLEYQRATLEWKTRGLDDAGLRARLHPTTMTLGGLLQHMARVEQHWFRRALHAKPASAPWNAVDWEQDPDWEWRTAAQDGGDALRAMWRSAVAESREHVAAALPHGGMDFIASGVGGETMRLGWIVLHMIEEYPRHNGHADLLRESVDGSTGE